MLPTPAQADAAAVGAIAREFHSWAAKGAADLIIPELEENSDDDEDTDDDDGADDDGDGESS